MDPAMIFNTLMLVLLMLSSFAVVILTSLTLVWLREKKTGYWLRLMLFGIGLYNGLFSLLLLLNVTGVRQTTLGQIFFIVYVLAHLMKASTILMFLMYLLGIVSDKPNIRPLPIIGEP